MSTSSATAPEKALTAVLWHALKNAMVITIGEAVVPKSKFHLYAHAVNIILLFGMSTGCGLEPAPFAGALSSATGDGGLRAQVRRKCVCVFFARMLPGNFTCEQFCEHSYLQCVTLHRLWGYFKGMCTIVNSIAVSRHLSSKSPPFVIIIYFSHTRNERVMSELCEQYLLPEMTSTPGYRMASALVLVAGQLVRHRLKASHSSGWSV